MNRFVASIARRAASISVVGAFVTLVGHSDIALADACIPHAIGVPGQSGPPDFLGTSPQPYLNYFNPDPRWQGSVAVGHGGSPGAAPHFRALRWTDPSTSQTYLYLSWAVHVAPAAAGTDADYVQFGLYEPGTAAGYTEAAWAFKVRIPKTTEHITATPVVAADIEQLHRAAGSTSWGAILPGALPWLTTNAVWWSDCGGMLPCTDPRWMLNIRVPIVDPAGFVPSDPNSGLALSGNFRLWYDSQVQLSGVIQLHHAWPDGLNGPTPTNWSTFALDPSAWTQVQTAGSEPCTGGVAIAASDISTGNTPTHHIQTSGSNQFNIAPHNASGSPIAHDAITARVRIADWGSAGVGSNPDWTEICASTTSALSGNVASPGQFLTQCNWTVPDPCDYWNGTDPNPHGCTAPGSKYKHQCVLVELSKSSGSGTDIFFSRSSAWRNMDVVQASRFERAARISVRGLAPLDPALPRDVYLYVQTRNLAATLPADENSETGRSELGSESANASEKLEAVGDRANAAEEPRGGSDAPSQSKDQDPKGDNDAGIRRLPSKRGGIHPRVKKLLAAGAVDLDAVEQVAPTYIVHVFHDTGESSTVEGNAYTVVRAQPSFGYFVDHEGDITGWEHELAGANLTLVAPNLYKLAVPNDGVAEVRTVIESLPKAEDPTDPTPPTTPPPAGCSSWSWVLLVVLLLVMFVLLRRRPN